MKKLLNKKGFTLMEMLIVVAIIVILVAISIPTFSGALDEANAATDAANFRAAKGALVTKQLDSNFSAGDTSYYNFDKGDFQAGQDENSKGKCSTHKDAYVRIVNGEVKWVDKDGNALEDAKQKCK